MCRRPRGGRGRDRRRTENKGACRVHERGARSSVSSPLWFPTPTTEELVPGRPRLVLVGLGPVGLVPVGCVTVVTSRHLRVEVDGHPRTRRALDREAGRHLGLGEHAVLHRVRHRSARLVPTATAARPSAHTHTHTVVASSSSSSRSPATTLCDSRRRARTTPPRTGR